LKTKITKNLTSTYKYKIFEERKLIIESFVGDISFDFLKNCMLKGINDPNYKNLKYGVCDLRQANFILSDEEIKSLFEYTLKHDENLSIKWATLTDGPYETAMSMIFELQASKYYGYKIFSTVDAAEKYLKIKLSEEDLKFNPNEQ
jgi:hypothetical protein